MESPIITLTTDWNICDFFVGKVKGRLLSLLPDAKIIDITHTLPPFQLQRAIFIARSVCYEYPQDTIHIIDVAMPYETMPRYLAIECDGQYYICTDNGLPYGLFFGRRFRAYDTSKVNWKYHTFPALDLFCKVAVMIAHGFDIEEFGNPVKDFVPITDYNAISKSDWMELHVIYFDSYGNAYLDISYDDFERARNGRKFTMNVNEHKITNVHFGYIPGVDLAPTSLDSLPANKPQPGAREFSSVRKLILTVSSTSMLQLAVVGGSAEQLLGMHQITTIRVTFGDSMTQTNRVL